MKQDCAVIQDLIILYEDDVLSSESRQMVEAHIEQCEECRKIYEKASASIPDIQETLADMEEPLKKTEKEWEEMAVKAIAKFRRRLTFKHIIIGGLLFIAFILTTNLAGYLTPDDYGISTIFSKMPSKEIDVKEMYRLKNGDIYMTLSSEKGFYTSEIPVLESPVRPLRQNTDEAYYSLGFEKSYGLLAKLKDSASMKEITYIFPMEKMVRDYRMSKETYHWSCSEISCSGIWKSDKKILWEKGQEVPEAPLEIEKRVIAAYVCEGDFKKAQEELEANEGLKGLSIFEIYEEYYTYDDGGDWWSGRTAYEIYAKPGE